MFRPGITERLTSLILNGKSYEARKGDVLLSTDDHRSSIHLIKSGYIKRYQITNSGTLSIQNIYGPNEIFPITNILKVVIERDIYDGPDTYYYEAMGRAKVVKIDEQTLREAVQKDPILYRDLLGIASDRLQTTVQQLENLSLAVYYNRVAHQLWFFANKFSVKDGQKAKLLVPLTHQDIADILSTTRETVSVCMSKLQKKGLVKSGRYLLIPDTEKLKHEAYS